MTELELALQRWQRHAEKASFHHHPTIWVSHFDGDDMLGEVGAHEPSGLPKAAMYLASPFGVSDEVSDTFVVVDRNHRLAVTRLAFDGRGVRTTDWRLTYRLGDHGDFGLGAPMMLPPRDYHVSRALHEVGFLRCRRQGFVTFYEAFSAALTLAEAEL